MCGTQVQSVTHALFISTTDQGMCVCVCVCVFGLVKYNQFQNNIQQKGIYIYQNIFTAMWQSKIELLIEAVVEKSGYRLLNKRGGGDYVFNNNNK